MKLNPPESTKIEILSLGKEEHPLVVLDNFLAEPEAVIADAALQKFAHINPHYPGIRAELGTAAIEALCEALSPVLGEVFGPAGARWEAQGWYSIVTTPPARLAPIQRLPHVDGLDPDQVALMLYLHRTPHGGTGLYRHNATGLESLTAETFPAYKAQLEGDIAAAGLPAPAYIGDGAPHFTRIHAEEGRFNRAILYRGNTLHSGLIDNHAELPADPATGRLTVNAFLRPVQG